MSENEDELIKKFWADPKNVEWFRKRESEIMKRVNNRLWQKRCGRTPFTEEDSIARAKRVGRPNYEFDIQDDK